MPVRLRRTSLLDDTGAGGVLPTYAPAPPPVVPPPVAAVPRHVQQVLSEAANGSLGPGVVCELQAAEAAEAAGASHCPPAWDEILCWPPTPAGTLAVQQCFEELRGVKYDPLDTASRWCFPNGSWHLYSNYTLCKELAPLPLAEADGWAVELTNTVYQVGYVLSLIALIFAVTIFASFRDLHCLRNVIHTNLMCAYISADSTWLLNNTIQTELLSSTQCLILLVLFHYFYLTTFTWMFVEGLYLYILVVETFTRRNPKLRFYMFIGWGSPVVFVSLWVLVRFVTPPPEPQPWQGEALGSLGAPGYSWMLPHWSDWLYQAPALVVLAANCVFLVVIMWVLITKLRSATSLETQQSRKATKALLVLIPLLGMTYVLTMAAPPEGAAGAAAYAAVRAVLLSTQGLMVALLYCFLNAEVRRALHHRWHRWREARDLASRPCPACAKDWSPRSRTESIRLYCPPSTGGGGKRESTASQSTTTTLLGPHQVTHPPIEHAV